MNMPTQQDLYYAELRLERITNEYLNACHRVKGFQHSSIGIAMEDKMNKLQKFISTGYPPLNNEKRTKSL